MCTWLDRTDREVYWHVSQSQVSGLGFPLVPPWECQARTWTYWHWNGIGESSKLLGHHYNPCSQSTLGLARYAGLLLAPADGYEKILHTGDTASLGVSRFDFLFLLMQYV